MPAAKRRKLALALAALAVLVGAALPVGASIPRPGDQLLEPDPEALLAALEASPDPPRPEPSAPDRRFELLAPAAVDRLLFTGRPPRLHLFAELETRVRASYLLSLPQPLEINELIPEIAPGDRETGLYYAKARYYDPELGLFLSEDPALGQIDTPPSLHRYLYAYQNPTVYVDPTGRAARKRELAEQQEELSENPEQIRAVMAKFVGDEAAEGIDPAFLAAVLQRTASGTRLLNLVEDVALTDPDKFERLSEEDREAVRKTVKEVFSLVEDVTNTVKLIREEPTKAGVAIVSFVKERGRQGIDLLRKAAEGDEQAEFVLQRFLEGVKIDSVLAVVGGGLGSSGSSAGSSGRGLFDDLVGFVRKLRKGRTPDLDAPNKRSSRVRPTRSGGESGGGRVETGAVANARGLTRESRVADLVGGQVSRQQIKTEFGSTDLDVLGPNGELITVGGPAKSLNLSKFGSHLKVMRTEAMRRGVPVMVYLEEGTPMEVVELAKRRLGEGNVVVFEP